MPSDDQHPFASYLETLRENRAALAALRRGLGKPSGYAPEMFPYVVPFVHADASAWQEEAHYIVASLFGLHPVSILAGNMGSHFAMMRQRGVENTPLERRFTALLAAHPDDLGFYLRQAVSLLRSKDVPVNWHQLMRDVLRWYYPEQRARVHKQWAREFWRADQRPLETESANDQVQ